MTHYNIVHAVYCCPDIIPVGVVVVVCVLVAILSLSVVIIIISGKREKGKPITT